MMAEGRPFTYGLRRCLKARMNVFNGMKGTRELLMKKVMLATFMLTAAAVLTHAVPVKAAELPAAIKARGTLSAAIVPNYPPLDLRDPATNELSGLDVDLGNAIAAKLGVKMDWQETSFEQMISAVDTGRVDVILSGMTDLASRHDKVSFVDYLRSGPQFFVQASRAKDFPDMLALCGNRSARADGLPFRAKLPTGASSIANRRESLPSMSWAPRVLRTRARS